MIAVTASEHGFTMVTRNVHVQKFAHIRVVGCESLIYKSLFCKEKFLTATVLDRKSR